MSSNASDPAGHLAPPYPHRVISHATRSPAEPDRSGAPIRLFILSDVHLLREGLVSCLARQECLHIAGHGDLATLPEQIVDSGPEVLLVDIATSRGLQQSATCRALSPALKIVAIAVAEVEQDILACAEAGVSGFVLRDGSISDVIAAIHNAMRDELVCSPRVAAALFGRLATLSARTVAREPAAGVDTLTPREHEIIRFVGEGLSNKEIARVLRIRNSTVKNHMHNVLSKLQIRRRGEISKHLHPAGPASSAPSRVQSR
ncbi:response regulator containing a CheY-like receiver domain and an HTH DNA-binding domain [Bradyrhizobium sp. YR681]|uniref:LuxR C-terminal-related transcriptional regulator n=1 Tax=Bradyrhizobium sp. YR681 TaxID=1144344 RepID=UPI00026F51DF|nr:response regulator transcription factor [Bradyrhizobium sp. YR681]EJN07224.1 response regulator containing a CheY-like receiver domain and an HTH DNA-binding domain [Bradyrhizobium sp. YR681]